MKKMEFTQERRGDESRVVLASRRDFLKTSALGIAALSTGGILFTPRSASAQTYQIHGVTVASERISDTIANLTRNSASYQDGEASRDGIYRNGVRIQPQRYSSGISINLRREEQSTIGVVVTSTQRDQGVTYGGDITDFLRMIKRVTDQDVRRARVIIDRTRDPDRGDPVISMYALPVNLDGDLISRHSGGYLAAGASYYPERRAIYGASCLLLEPGTPEPSRIASR